MAFDPNTLPDVAGLRVGIIGGTGDQGRGLGYRLARVGQKVIIGSRTVERGEAAARDVAGMPGVTVTVSGGDNLTAAQQADLVIVALPWGGHAGTLSALAGALAGKIVVDCVNPLGFDERGPYALRVPEGSATEQAAGLLPDARVCGAFHHVSAELLLDPSVAALDQDVLVLGDDREAVVVVQALAARLPGTRGLYAGRLRNAHQVEAMTANLVAVNRRYRVHAGLRLTGV